MTKLNLGKALLETDKARDSIKHFKESHEIALSRFKKYPNAAEKRDLAFTYLNLGNSILKIEGKNQAKDYFYKYLKLNQELFDEEPLVEHQSELGYSHYNIALYIEDESEEKRKGHLKKAQAHFTLLKKEQSIDEHGLNTLDKINDLLE